jgi:hypothetical protein
MFKDMIVKLYRAASPLHSHLEALYGYARDTIPNTL